MNFEFLQSVLKTSEVISFHQKRPPDLLILQCVSNKLPSLQSCICHIYNFNNADRSVTSTRIKAPKEKWPKPYTEWPNNLSSLPVMPHCLPNMCWIITLRKRGLSRSLQKNRTQEESANPSDDNVAICFVQTCIIRGISKKKINRHAPWHIFVNTISAIIPTSTEQKPRGKSECCNSWQMAQSETVKGGPRFVPEK